MLKNLLNYADNQSQNLDSFSVTEHLQKTFVIFSKFLALGGGGLGALVKKGKFLTKIFL